MSIPPDLKNRSFCRAKFSLRKLHHTILTIKLVLLEIFGLVGFIYLLLSILRGEIHR